MIFQRFSGYGERLACFCRGGYNLDTGMSTKVDYSDEVWAEHILILGLRYELMEVIGV